MPGPRPKRSIAGIHNGGQPNEFEWRLIETANRRFRSNVTTDRRVMQGFMAAATRSSQLPQFAKVASAPHIMACELRSLSGTDIPSKLLHDPQSAHWHIKLHVSR